jgi:hypothetical protein
VSPTINDYKSELRLGFGELGPVIKWCDLNCTGNWCYNIFKPAGQEKGEYEFFFNLEADYINFLLYMR